MNPFDSRPETEEHIDVVRGLVGVVAGNLIERGDVHDASKREEPEKAVFDEYTPKLSAVTYGSPEYKEQLAGMGPGLEHHYAANDHHPEHFPVSPEHEVDVWFGGQDQYGREVSKAACLNRDCSWAKESLDDDDLRDEAGAHEREHSRPDGVAAMNVMQLTEMLCDWIAAGRRHADGGDIHRSIDQNASRFGYGEEIEQLLHTTADAILELEP
jgi:hypothetical protein